MTATLRQLLAFKKALLQFGRELTEEEQDEYLASVYHEESEELQKQVTYLAHQVKKLPRVRKISKKTKKVRKKRV